MKTRIILFFAVVVALAFTSCNSYKKSKTGMPYKIYASKNGTKVDSGSFVKLHFAQKLNDSLLYESYGKLPIYFQYVANSPGYEVTEIFSQLKNGDSVVSIQFIDTLLKKNPTGMPPFMKKGDKIFTYVTILGVFKDWEASAKDEQNEKQIFLDKEIKEVGDSIAKNKITAIKTKNGAYVQFIEPGTGKVVDSGSYVSIKYKGTSFSGKIFDTNMDTSFHHTDPIGFTAGTGGMPGGSIIGLDDALLLMRVGSKAKVYIPSLLGYGANPGTPDIKPFEHLIFEVEILSVNTKAPTASNVPSIQIEQPQIKN